MPGNQKIAILKQVRINTQLGLKAAKDLVQSFPNLLPVFPKDVPTAQTIKTALENAGATVSII